MMLSLCLHLQGGLGINEKLLLTEMWGISQKTALPGLRIYLWTIAEQEKSISQKTIGWILATMQ